MQMPETTSQEQDQSVNGLFTAIKLQLAGIIIAFMASSVNYALVLFANTEGHEIALSVPIIGTALFTIVWGEATLRAQVANIKDATPTTQKTYAYKYISSQPYRLLRLMNFGLAFTLAASQLSILLR